MTKTFKDIQGIEEACWVGYKKVGMKKKGDRMVPNCVKEEVVDSLLGKDYVYESVADMYKGQFTKAQLAKMKQTWSTKKASDVDQRTKDFVRNLDQFSQMDIKQANIKYISNLIDEVQKEEVELVNDFKNIIEENEMRSSIRRSEDLKEFNSDQLERLAKAYSVMKGKNISVDNANKLGKMMKGVPDSSLNALRKKKIPFLSGLALSRMIQRKIPVTESALEEDLDKDDKKTIEPIIKQLQKSVTAHGKQAKQLKKDIADETDLSKSQIKKVHKQADDLPKKDFMKRYGKDGDSVRYATATNMVKKKLGLGEEVKNETKNPYAGLGKHMGGGQYKGTAALHKKADDYRKKIDKLIKQGKYGEYMKKGIDYSKYNTREDNELIKKGELKMNESYKLKLNSAMEHYKITSLAELKDEDQKAFFSYVDGLTEGLTAGQKKLPAGLQKAILAKQGKKDEMHDMKKKEMKEEDAYDKDDPKQKPKKEDLVGGQKKLDKDKDGDLDAKDFAALRKTKSEAVKTGEADAEPKTKELNAMVKNPMNAMKDNMNAMKDMSATYMASNVKAAVKDNGGADMAKVKDAPDMKDAMKKINATYGVRKENNNRYLQTKPGSLEEAVLKSRGLVK